MDKEHDYLKMLKEFHDYSKNEWKESPVMPTKDRQELRAHLIVEEAREFEDAIRNNDLVEVADALIDLLYVTFGSLGEFGLAGIAKDLFEEVHRSNMSKLCTSYQDAVETVEWYASSRHPSQCSAMIKPCGENFLVIRRSDGKTLKNRYYKPADLKTIIDLHRNK